MTTMISEIDFDGRAALVVVDVQNDFAHPEGGLYVEEGEQVVPVINRLVSAARSAGALVVYTQDWHPATTPHFAKDGGTWPVHCVAGTWGAELHPDLEVAGPVVRKGTGGDDGYSGFSARDATTGAEKMTGLHDLLEQRGVQRVVVVGLAQDVCVKDTALDARRFGYDTSVIRDATRAVNLTRGDDQRALETMAAAGVRVAGGAAGP